MIELIETTSNLHDCALLQEIIRRHLHLSLELYRLSLGSVSVLCQKTRKRTCENSFFVGGLNHFQMTAASKEFCALKGALVEGGLPLLRLLVQCFAV